MDLCEFKASLIYRVSSGIGSEASQRNPDSKNKNKTKQKPIFIYSFIIQERPPDNSYPQGHTEVKWDAMEMLDLRRFKKAIVSHGMHSPYVKVNTCFIQNKITPKDCKDLVTAVL